LAAVLLVSGTIHQLDYLVALWFQAYADVPGAAFDPLEPPIALAFAVAAVALLAGLRRKANSQQ
jgi:MYXO-CTERM domain-containing protein